MRVASFRGLLILLVSELAAARPGVHKVALSKQYVPVHSAGRVVAHKSAYFGSVSVGLPRPQTFTVLFDTGSGHFILPSASCADSACEQHRRYNQSLSSSALAIDFDGAPAEAGDAAELDRVDIRFGVGTASGPFAEETVCLGRGGDPGGCVRLRIVAASAMSEEPFKHFAFDGVAGLGLEALALHEGFSLLGQMRRQSGLGQPLFGVYLASEAPEGVPAGEIAFGGVSEERMAEPLAWVPVENPELGYWQVRIRSVRVGNQTVELCADGGCRAILDTGTSLLGVPKQALSFVQGALAGTTAGSAAAGPDCRRGGGPPIVFDLGSASLRLSAEDYLQPAPAQAQGGALCRAALMPVEAAEPLGPRTFIFGEPVLRRYYTAYDWQAKRVGLALSEHGEQLQEPALPLSI